MPIFYYGTKLIKAEPMNRAEYNAFRGWALPKDENGEDQGYLVEYQDGGPGNVASHEGYVSWSPKEVFENSYRPSGRLTFGHALEALKAGYRVGREGWNGKGLWLQLVSADDWELKYLHDAYGHEVAPFICIKSVDDKIVPWLASQTDVLAEDWAVVSWFKKAVAA